MSTDGPLLTAVEAAEILRVTRRTVEMWGKAGRIPVVTLPSGRRRYRRADIDEMIANGRKVAS